MPVVVAAAAVIIEVVAEVVSIETSPHVRVIVVIGAESLVTSFKTVKAPFININVVAVFLKLSYKKLIQKKRVLL